MSDLIAIRWSEDYNPPVTNPTEHTAILDGCEEHRPWFPDQIWEEGPLARRAHASRYIVDAMLNGSVWSILQNARVVGIFILNSLRPGVDASCHFIFFDHKLRSKRLLCLEAMDAEFEYFDLATLRVEVPEYARALCGFLKAGLGFRYEAERVLDDPSLAKQASIKHRTIRYKGRWNDSYLMSVTREEFQTFVRTVNDTQRGQRSPDPGTDPASGELSPRDPAESIPSS